MAKVEKTYTGQTHTWFGTESHLANAHWRRQNPSTFLQWSLCEPGENLPLDAKKDSHKISSRGLSRAVLIWFYFSSSIVIKMYPFLIIYISTLSTGTFRIQLCKKNFMTNVLIRSFFPGFQACFLRQSASGKSDFLFPTRPSLIPFNMNIG